MIPGTGADSLKPLRIGIDSRSPGLAGSRYARFTAKVIEALHAGP